MAEGFDFPKGDPLTIDGKTPSWGDEIEYAHVFSRNRLNHSEDPASCREYRSGSAPNMANKCIADTKHAATINGLLSDPVKLARDIEQDFNVFDKRKNGEISVEDAQLVMMDPHASAKDRLLAEVLKESIVSWGPMGGRMTMHDLKEIEAVNDPEYAAARTNFEAKLKDHDFLIQSLMRNYAAFSMNGEIDRNSGSFNLNPEQRVLASVLNDPATQSYLFDCFKSVSKDAHWDSNADDWRLTYADLQKVLDQDAKAKK